MMITSLLFYASLLCGTLLTSIGFLALTPVIWIPAILLIAGIWGWAFWKNKKWVSGGCFLFFVYSAIKLSYQDLTVLVPLIVMICSYSAWNIEIFERRMKDVSLILHQKKIIRQYLKRLILVATLPLLVAAVAIHLKAGVSFLWIVVLSLGAIAAVGRMGWLSVRQDH